MENMGVITFNKLTPEQVALLDLENNRQVLSPEDKFKRAAKKLTHGRAGKLRKFHFLTIEHEQRIYLFNGDGKEIGIYENSMRGYRTARSKARDLFCAAKITEQNGGYNFTPDKNLEYMSPEEIDAAYASTLRHLSYKLEKEQE